MAEILKDAGRVVEEREKAINADRKGQKVFLVNEAQCTRLWENLRAVYEAFSSSLPIQQECLPLFKRFYMLVMRADAILGKCSCEQSWLEAAIFGDNPHVFKELSLDLLSCIDLFYYIPEAHCNAKTKILAPNVKVAIHNDVADEDFQKDVAKLMAKLEELLKDTDSEENQKHLARYLRGRENSRVSPDRADLNPDARPGEGFYEVYRQTPEYLGSVVGGETGGFGEVSKVKWLGLICAQKKLKNPENVGAFEKEVRTLVALNHPHIVKLLCSSKRSSRSSKRPKLCFLMELMPMSLSAFIKQRKKEQQDKGVSAGAMPFGIAAAIEMMLQMALGMEYLHERGVVHRDLKSANILVAPCTHPELSDQGYADIKLTDFGLAKTKVDGLMEPTCKMLGTTRHIAPEAMDPLPSQRIDWRKADTYSFGITCSEILAGELPYNELEQQGEVRQKVKSGLRPALPSDCPPYLGELLQRCWAQNPDERPSFEGIVDTLTRFRTCLLIGIEPERAPAKSVPLRQTVWSLIRYVQAIMRFERRPVLCLDESDKAPFEAAIEKYIFSKLDMVEALCSRMKVHLKRVQVCHTQCEHLFQQYLEGKRKVKATFHEAFRSRILWDLYRSGKLQQWTGLDRLLCSMMAAKELFRGCGGSEWKRTALAISPALIPQSRAYSIFGFHLWELYWNLFVIHRVMLGATIRRFNTSLQVQSASGNLLIQWCEKRCRLVLRRIPNNDDAEEEFRRADVDRQAEDRRNLLARLEESSVGSWEIVYFIFSRFRLPEAAIEDGLAARLKKKLLSKSAAVDFDAHQDCYWIGELKLQKEEYIARGGMKEVRTCRWLGEVVAVSTLDDLWTEDFSCFKREVEALARVQHPNVVHIIGYGYRDNREVAGADATHGYIVMELVQDDLWNLIKRNTRLFNGAPFPLMVAIDILIQIVEAMLHLQECGVVHRDLNPSNILVRPKYTTKSNIVKDMDVYYTVKLTGFNGAELELNRPLSSAVFFDPMVGTMRYMAPEVMKVPAQGYAWSVDVWSFGMTAYEIVTGKSPFESEFYSELKPIILEGQHPRLPDAGCPHILKNLIEQCWAQEPSKRPSFKDIRKELWALKYNEEVTDMFKNLANATSTITAQHLSDSTLNC